MKKAGNRILGLLLAMLMMVQVPYPALAQDLGSENIKISSYEAEASYDTEEIAEEETTAEDATAEEGPTEDRSAQPESDLYEESLTEETDILLEESETDADVLPEEQILGEEVGAETEAAEAMAVAADGSTQETTEETKEIRVTVSVSKDGKFLDDKNGDPMAGRTVTLTGQSSYTMDDALSAAHRLYYKDGVDGYDFHEDETGNSDGLIYKLWGYDRDSVPGIRYARNNDCKLYQTSLTQTVEDGDRLYFYIEQRKNQDRLAFFTETEETISQGEQAVLHLRQSTVYGNAAKDGNIFSECSGASIYIDGVKQEDLTTDENGEVILPSLAARETPYFITAEKLVKNEDGTTATAITAAYLNLRVVPGTGQMGEYIEGVSLKATDGDTTKEYQMNTFDGMSTFVLPTDLSHGKFYLNVTTKESLPENASIYAVYTDPSDETVCRVPLQKGSYTYLKNTSLIYTYKAIRLVTLEVRQNGSLIQTVQIPISYKASFRELSLKDSWGHEINCLTEDTLEVQQIQVSIPKNSEYIDLYGYTSGWGYLSENPELISIEGVELTNTGMGTLRFVPDWNMNSEYVAKITLPESEEKNISEETKYTIVIKPGETDYTPVLSYEGQMPGNYRVLQGEEADSFIIQPTVLRADEGKLFYQWYQGDTFEEFEKIDGATKASYQVSTSKAHYYNYYKCVVSYEIDGKTYTAESELYRVRVYPLTLADPKITEQPEDIITVKGMPLKEQLSVELSDIKQPDVDIQYQWYKNTKKNTTDGTVISGATQSSYVPDVQEAGITYYYCKIRYQLKINTKKQTKTINSEYVYSNPACVTVTEATLPWDGNGSSKSPYLIRDLTDLEALRDKVNKEGFTFDGVHFQMTADITLSTNWKSIGSSKEKTFGGSFDGDGHTLTVGEGGLPLLGYINGAEVKNLKIYGKQIAGAGLVNSYTGTGLSGNAITIENVRLLSGSQTLKSGLVASTSGNGYAHASAGFVVTIRNCVIEEGVVIGYNGDQKQIGSIAGRVNGTIENCESYATVKGSSYVGGILGTRDNAMGQCVVKNSSFHGTVEGKNLVGGIVGGGYDNSTAPNGARPTILGCSVDGTVKGETYVGGIFGGDLYVAQTWYNVIGSINGNSFTGSVSGNEYVGGIIGYLDSLNKYDIISGNYYAAGCGASKGIAFVKYIDTNCASHETTSGALYINTENGTDGCPTVEGCTWQIRHNRTDDPMGADAAKLANTEGVKTYVEKLEIAGDYKTEYFQGDSFDTTGMIFTATLSDGTTTHPTAKEMTITGFDGATKGKQNITIFYREAYASLSVKVRSKNTNDIKVTFSLLGDSKHSSDKDGKVHTLAGGNLTTWVPETVYYVDPDASVYDLLKQAAEEYDFELIGDTNNSYGSVYIRKIAWQGDTLGEFDNGGNSGWMVTVNGVHLQVGVGQQMLDDGDVVIFHYTDDFTREEHTHQWGAWTVVSQATVFAPKLLSHKCVICGLEDTEYTGDSLKPTMKVNATTLLLKTSQKTSALKVTGLAKGDSIASYKSGNTKLFTVDKKGVITATKKTGSAKLTITLASGFKKTVIVKVQKKAVATTKITGLKTKVTVKKGAKLTLKPSRLPITSVQKFTYASSNKKVATVSSKGVITAKKAGTAKITVKSGNKKVVVTVTVPKTKTTALSVSASVTVKKGKTYTLKVKKTPANSDEKITYASANKKIATVTSAGKIKGVKKGSTIITVKSGKITKKVKVTVK